MSEPARYGLPRTARLRTARDFRQVYRHGRRTRGDHFTVVGLPTEDGVFRLGLSVSKANGRAVRRNKIKRVFREAFRLERPTLPGGFDLILIPQPRERYELDDVRAELIAAVTTLRERKGQPQRRRPGKPRRGKGGGKSGGKGRGRGTDRGGRSH